MFVEFNCTLVRWGRSPSNNPGLSFSEAEASAVSWWFMLCSSHSVAPEVVPLQTVELVPPLKEEAQAPPKLCWQGTLLVGLIAGSYSSCQREA